MRSESPAFIASEKLLWLRVDGSEAMITVRIGTPYRADAATWACPVALEGLDGRCCDMCGISSLQALCLAIGLAEQRLRHLLDSQDRLLLAEDRSPLDPRSLAALFGSRHPPPDTGK